MRGHQLCSPDSLFKRYGINIPVYSYPLSETHQGISSRDGWFSQAIRTTVQGDPRNLNLPRAYLLVLYDTFGI